MSPRIRWAVVALALVGLGFALWSTWVHYRLLTDPTYVSPCDVGTSFSCTQAYTSQFGSVGRVPTALFGVIWFGLVALIAGFARAGERESVAGGYVFGLAVVGLAVVLYLGYASYFVLGTGCLLCIGTYVCVLGIFVLSSVVKTIPMTQLPLRLSSDLRAVAGRPAALAVAMVYLASVVSAMTLFPTEEKAAEQVAASAQTSSASNLPADVQKNFATAWAQQNRTNLGIPLQGAKVVIVKFNDYECGGCKSAESYYKPILDRFAKSHPGAIKYVLKDWPWDTSCNVNAGRTIPGHEAACDAAVAARLARDKGKFDEMTAWLFGNQGTTKANLRAAVQRILGVTDFDRQYALKINDVKQDIADGGVLKIGSTPTYFINGVRLPEQLIPAEYFELAISLEIANAK
jgi:uncharacterized membrane protein/protein-disulfide isomerase